MNNILILLILGLVFLSQPLADQLYAEALETVSDRKVNDDAYLYTGVCAALLLDYMDDYEQGMSTSALEREYGNALDTCNQNILYFYDYCNSVILSYCNDQDIQIAMESYIRTMQLQEVTSPDHYLDVLGE